MVDLPTSMPIEAQMALDNGSLDVPAKIFTIFVLSLKKGHREGGRKSARDFNSERLWCKNFQRNLEINYPNVLPFQPQFAASMSEKFK